MNYPLRSFLVAGAGAAAIATLWWFALIGLFVDPPDRLNPRPVPLSATTAQLQAMALLGTRPAVPDGAGALEAAPAAPPELLLGLSASDLAETNNWRKWVADALNKPEQGGVFKAKWVTLVCNNAETPLNLRGHDGENTQLHFRRLAAQDKLARRCQEFATGEVFSEFMRALHSPNRQQDPLNRHRELLAQATIDPKADRAVLMQSYFQAAHWGGGFFEGWPVPTDARKGIFFDGAWHAPNSLEHRMLSFSSLLSGCAQSGQCGASDPMVLSLCANEGYCVESRFALVQALLKESGIDLPPDHAEQQRQWVERFERQIRAKNAGAFLAPQ